MIVRQIWRAKTAGEELFFESFGFCRALFTGACKTTSQQPLRSFVSIGPLGGVAQRSFFYFVDVRDGKRRR